MVKEVVLRLDEATARDLHQLLYTVGEHTAAGAPILPPSPEADRRLGWLMNEIDHQLGRMTMAEAMQASIERKAREEQTESRSEDEAPL